MTPKIILPALAIVLATPALAQTQAPAQPVQGETTPATTGQAPTGQGTAGVPASGASGANPVVGGAEMLPTRNIVENASQSANHGTLVRAIQAAELSATLSGPGPFTVFAPTDEAFGALPAGTVEGLLQPQNRPTLVQILNYHVVPGRISFTDISEAMDESGGTATYTTVNGQQITLRREGGALRVGGQGGSAGYVGQYDIAQSNGVIHVINGVLVPNIQAPPAATTAPAAPAAGTQPPAAAPGS